LLAFGDFIGEMNRINCPQRSPEGGSSGTSLPSQKISVWSQIKKISRENRKIYICLSQNCTKGKMAAGIKGGGILKAFYSEARIQKYPGT